MKKRVISVILMCLGLFMVGCSRGIPVEDAAQILVNHYIYRTETEAFNENFTDSGELKQLFAEQKQVFQGYFIEGLVGVDAAVSQEQADEIYQLLATQVSEETSFSIKDISTTEDLANVVYQVHGLAMTDLVVATSQKLAAQIAEDNTLAKEQAQLITATIALLKEQIPTVTSTTEPVAVSLQLKKECGKWQLVNGQGEALNALYLAFYTGANSQEQFESQLTQALKTNASSDEEN